jgi:hypothetical protein
MRLSRDAISFLESPGTALRVRQPAGRGLTLWLGPVLVLALLVLLGCTSDVELLASAAPTPPPAATVIPQEHALAIIGIDFDPPLDYNQIVSKGGVSLLVAVRNQGLMPESNVRVRAQLLDPADRSPAHELLNQAESLKTLAPGELRVVRFSQASELPKRDRYKLEVQIEPVPGETDTADNYRAYEIAVYIED